jgi:phosphate transport system substrate-binding protein
MFFSISRKSAVVVATLLTLALFIVACGGSATPTQMTTAPQPTSAGPAAPGLAGTISIDGSSTVFPITEAVAEEFGKLQPDVKVTVGIKGTGGGFQAFCSANAAERTDIQDASRAISASEIEACKTAGVEYVELLVGLDGLTVVVNPSNEFATCLTTAELKKIWDTGSTLKNWNEVNSSFPSQELTLYGPGTDSGTFDFFTEEINGEPGQSRSDYTASEDDNTLVQGVAGDQNALGYFGLAYYLENQDKLKSVQVDRGEGCIAPTFETVANGTYSPLSRPLYIYVNIASLAKPEVFEFVAFYLANAKELVDEVGYVNVADEVYAAGLKQIAEMKK